MLQARLIAALTAARAWLAAASLSICAAAGAAAPDAAQPDRDALRIEAELGVGHESSSSPLVRVSPDGALVVVEGLSRLAGRVVQGSVNASGDWPLAGALHLGLTALAERRHSDTASGLGFGLGLVDLALRAPLAGGTAGIGPSLLWVSVAGQSFRQARALHVDWAAGDAQQRQLNLRVELARYRHAPDFIELDAEVGAASGSVRWKFGAPALDSLELGFGLRRERNRRGLVELSNRDVHASVALAWAGILGAQWTANLMLQRSRFDAGLFDGDPARRDRFMALDLSAEWAVGASSQIVASVGLMRNRARPSAYDNRHRQSSLAWSGHW